MKGKGITLAKSGQKLTFAKAHEILQKAGEVREVQMFDFNLKGSNANKLFLAPIFLASNILTGMFAVMRNVKDEALMWYMGRIRKIIQANDDCKFTPKGGVNLKLRKMEVRRMKVNMSQCNDEFFNTCLERTLGNELEIFNPDSSDHIKKLKKAMLTVIQEAIVDDLFTLAFFGDRSNLDPFFGLTDGIFKKLDEAITAGEITEIATGSGAALPAGASVTIFKAMHKNSHIALRRLPKSKKTIYVSESIEDNYREYLESLGTELSHTMIVDGVERLRWNGYPIVPVPEWDNILAEDLAQTDQHRAILTANKNLVIGTDITGSAAKVRIYQDPVHKKEWYYDAAFKLGTNFAHAEYVVYAR